MPTFFSRLDRKIKFAFFATLLQAALCAPAWSTDTPAVTEPAVPHSKLQEWRERAADLTEKAMDMLGIRYKRGGNTPENGLDCSGFVRYVFKDVVSSTLPRTSAEMSRIGAKVDPKDLQPGDLVFYNTLRRGFSHVGIYLGDNKFIHSPSAGGQVRVESMDLRYWKKRFNGARRIDGDTKS